MIKKSQLPLNRLRSFEAAARLQSFSAAADELCVTHGAVSQQIKQLELQLGTPLFERHSRGVQLTNAGQTLFPVLSEALSRLQAAMEGLTARASPRALRVTTTPFLAARWLVPRLTQWRQDHPEDEVHLLPELRFLDVAKGEADIAIRCGRPPWPGLEAQFLMPIHLSPLCSPNLLEAGAARPRQAGDLLRHSLIHADIVGHRRGEEWDTWLTAQGLRVGDADRGLYFHDPALALQAAMDGLGIAMGYLEFAADHLRAGRLVQPCQEVVRHGFAYYLVHNPATAPQTAAFRHWVMAEAEAFRHSLPEALGKAAASIQFK